MCSSFCYQREKEFQKSHERHRQDLITSFDYLRNHLPRTLVNYIIIPGRFKVQSSSINGLPTLKPIVSTTDFQILRTLKNMPPQCGIYHLIECPCLFGLPNQRIIKRSMSMIKKWQQVEREVVSKNLGLLTKCSSITIAVSILIHFSGKRHKIPKR